MIKFENYGVKYGDVTVLDNINFEIENGEICVFVGASGCGKSTIINSICNIIKYDGSITYNDKPIENDKLTIGLVSQNYDLYKFKTVYENIILGLQLKKMKIDKEQIYKLAEELGIKEQLDKYPNKLSGGQQQRCSLLRNYLINPDIMLLDEPFSALDAMNREKIQEVFLELFEKNKTTTVLITHSIEEAVYMGDKIAIMKKNENIVDTIRNKRGLNRTDDEFMQNVKLVRKYFEELR